MKIVSSDFPCPGCTHQNKASYPKPTPAQPSIVKFVCKNCGSDVMSRVKRAGNNAVTMEMKLLNVGKRLEEMWLERYKRERAEEFKNQSKEDQGEQVLGMDHQPVLGEKGSAGAEPGPSAGESA